MPSDTQDAFDAIYSELKKIAHHLFVGERSDHTLQPTAALNEAILRLLSSSQPLPEERSHFLALSARAMRNVLVEHARRRNADKRGAGQIKFEVREEDAFENPEVVDVLILHEALENLEAVDEHACKAIELQYFGGYTLKEVAEIVGRDYSTVRRDVADGMVWLRRYMKKHPVHD